MVVSNEREIFKKIIKRLNMRLGKSTAEEPNIVPYIFGPNKISFLIKSQDTKAKTKAKAKYYKIDMFRTSVADKWAMLLYSTGPKSHNIKMRAIAKKKGFLLNQQGLYTRDKKKKLSKNAKSEKY